MKLPLSLLAFYVNVVAAYAQFAPQVSVDTFSVGNFWANLYGGGVTYDVEGGEDGGVRYRDRFGQYATAIYDQGLWMAGLDPRGEVALAVQFYDMPGETDFYSGPINVSSGRRDTAAVFRRVFQVTRAQIDAHRADWADGRLDTPIPAVMNWPGTGNPGYGFRPGTGALAPFADVDGDGVYDPSAGDYPAVTGDRAAWWVMNDLDIHRRSGSTNPLGIEVQGLLEGFDGGASRNSPPYSNSRTVSPTGARSNSTPWS